MNRLNSTRFMTQEEFAKQFVELDMKEEVYPVGGIPMLVKDDKIYIDAEDSHTIIFGATGSKKTRMFVMPSIGIFARAGESFVVTDTKGELYERTMSDVVAHGYKSCCLNLRDFHSGVTWNPFALPYRYYHNGKKAKAMEFATEMAKMIVGEGTTEDTFWPTTAIDVLSGFILLLFEKADEGECHLKALVDLWKTYVTSRRRTLEKIKAEFGDTVIYQKISSLDNPSDKTVGSIEAFVVMGINRLCVNEDFVEFLSQEGIDLEGLAKEKNAIYLVIPDENTTYHFVVSLFLEQLYEVLLDKAQKEPLQKLPIRMNFLIDEFANIPKIQNMDAMITAARSRNIRFHLIVQGMKQLQQKYEDGADTISGNCNNWIYLYSKEFELLQEISRLCGEVIYDNNVRMPLFSEFDLQHLSKVEGESLVLAGRNYPCLSNLADIDEYPYPKGKVGDVVQWQKWEKISSFKWDKDESKNYYCKPTWTEANDFLSMMSLEDKETELAWLVAVGADGMIMAEKIFEKSLIDNGSAIGALYCEQIHKKGWEPELLEWYQAPTKVRERYNFMVKRFPRKVYMNLEHLGLEKFTKVADRKQEMNCIPTTKETKIELIFTDDVRREPNKQILLENLKAYCGNVGMTHILRHAFTKANEALLKTEYDNIPWRQLDRTRSKDGEEHYQFYKKGASGELVILVIKDYRFVRKPIISKPQ